MRLIGGNTASGLSIHKPGIVKASPPATIAPLLMIVWVTFISCREELRAFFNAAIERTVTKIVGHGRAPILRATYIEDAVMTSNPKIPMMIARAVRCRSIDTLPPYV